MDTLTLVEFNAWMEGRMQYSEMQPASQRYADTYLDAYWVNIDSLCTAEG